MSELQDSYKRKLFYCLKRKRILQSQPFLIFIAKIKFSTVFHLISCCTWRSLVCTCQLRPLDTNFRIVPSQAAFIVRMPEIVDFIAKFSNVAKYEEAMSKAFRNQELFFVVFCQCYAIPFPVCLGMAAQIDGYIENAAPDGTHQLALRILFLKMESP